VLRRQGDGSSVLFILSYAVAAGFFCGVQGFVGKNETIFTNKKKD